MFFIWSVQFIISFNTTIIFPLFTKLHIHRQIHIFFFDIGCSLSRRFIQIITPLTIKTFLQNLFRYLFKHCCFHEIEIEEPSFFYSVLFTLNSARNYRRLLHVDEHGQHFYLTFFFGDYLRRECWDI